MQSPSLHLPTAHIDVQRIVQNYTLLEKFSAQAKAMPDAPFAKAKLPIHFGGKQEIDYPWPSQLAVIKADAYGHGQIETAKAFLQSDIRFFASGSVQECAHLRQNLNAPAIILSLLGPITEEDVNTCQTLGIIPLIHNLKQIALLKNINSQLPIAIKCNSGMARLGFDAHELDIAIKALLSLKHVNPVLALSHLHSADSKNVLNEIKNQGTCFANMLKNLRAAWPHLAASLANSAGTIFAEEITTCIGPHICRPGIALYGSNPFAETEFAHKAKGLLSTMWVNSPILTTRNLTCGQGLGYGHSFIAPTDLSIAIIACGYADGYARMLSHKAQVCIDGMRHNLVGRVAMQMIAADITKAKNKNPRIAWLLGGPYQNGINAQEIAKWQESISYEVLCSLGNNARKYTNFSNLQQ